MPNDGIPFYLKVDSTHVYIDANKDTIGAISQNITDISVEANTTNLGFYEIPSNLPVLEENAVRFVLTAMVWESGQGGHPVEYPFYGPDTFTLNAKRADIYEHLAKFKYKSGSVFTIHEDFKVASAFTTDLAMVVDSNVEHGRCGMLTVNDVDTTRLTYTPTYFDLPEGQEIWLEVDYKCDVPVEIGFIGVTGGVTTPTSIMYVIPHPTWNKLYVKMSAQIAGTLADRYGIYFLARKVVGGSGGSVYLDNIKLVHF